MRFRQHTKLTSIYPSGRCSVIIRVSYQNKRVNLYTGITLKPNQWNENKERVKQGCNVDGYMYNVLNDNLDKMEKFVEDYFNNSAFRSTPTTLEDLKIRFKHRYTLSPELKSSEFFDLFATFREETAALKGWSKSRTEMMKRLENKIRTFKSDMTFSDLSTETMEKLKVYLSKTMYNDALVKHLSYFKQFITWAQKKKYEIHEDYFSYKPTLHLSKKSVRYLTLDELNSIYNLDLSKKDSLDRARDVFIFQCYTALRESDVHNLKKENIYQDSNKNYIIDFVSKKDKDRITFRLPRRAVEVYLKYRDNVYENDLLFPVISQQKYNDHLKELGTLANLQGEWLDYEYRLNEEIVIKTPKHQLSSHTARRTFIVTALNEGMPLDIIALITSHSDVSAMKPYIKANTRGTDMIIDAIDKTTGDNK